jgi:hypothetical protein
LSLRAAAITASVVLTTLGVASAAVAQDARPLPEPGMELAAGRYVSDVVGPTIEFSVDDGWRVISSGTGPIFTLEQALEPGAVLSVTRFDGAVFLDSCDPTSLSEVEASVPRLLAVIAGNPFLNPGADGSIEVDGYVGHWLDVATPAYTECQDWLLIWALPIAEGGEFVQMPDQQSRFIALDVEGDVIVIAIESLPGVPFGSLLEDSLELVASMTLEPGELAAASASPGPSAPPATAEPEPSSEPSVPGESPAPVVSGEADATA